MNLHEIFDEIATRYDDDRDNVVRAYRACRMNRIDRDISLRSIDDVENYEREAEMLRWEEDPRD